jgi:hypothetical protein
VLYHLKPKELKASFIKQAKILNPEGIAFHSFWYGDKEKEMHDLYFVYYTEDSLRDLIGEQFEILEFQQYTEMEKNDSLILVLRKRV